MAMSEAERAKLVDAAMRSGDAQAYLIAMESAFEMDGRADDATTAASLRLIHRAGEIELLMFMRAEWLEKTSNRHARPARST